jgi:hypothetical protein
MSDTYAIVVHPYAIAKVNASFSETIESDPRISDWWNHIPGFYIVVSDRRASELTALMKPYVDPWPFMVVKVDLDDAKGWLPNEAWSWLQKRHESRESNAFTV